MRTLAVLALAAAVAVAQNIEYKFVGNLSNAEADFKFRFSQAGSTNNVVAWISASADASASDKGAEAKANGIIGGATVAELTFNYPIVVAAYAKGKVSMKLEDMKSNLLNAVASGGYSKGLVGLVILSVDEVDDNGNEIKSYSMGEQGWGKLEDESPAEDEEGRKLYVYTTESDNFTLTFTTANVAGILSHANAPVAPASLEVILENKGLKLIDENNHFRVKVLLFTYGDSQEYSGKALVGKADDEQVYAAVSGKVNIDGNEVEAAVSLKGTEGEASVNVLVNFLKPFFEIGDYVRIANVDFPKGQSKFIYDPSVGAGRVVYDGSATTAVLSLVALLLSAVAALF